MKLYLFDIDGTLLDSHGLGGKALDETLRELTGKTYDLHKLDWFGNTDGAVITELLENIGYGGAELERLKSEIFERFAQKIRHDLPVIRRMVRILPGVKALLDAMDGWQTALVTGNIEETAYLKLEAAGLDGYFARGVGGFGDDRDARSEIVPFAVERARKHYRTDNFDKIVVIGDSHRDIVAGKKNDAVTVAVATGKLKACELAGYQPDHVFEDFSDTENVLRVLKSL